MPKTEEEKQLSWEDHLAEAIKSFRGEMKEWRGEHAEWPADFHTHRRAAQKEMLLAWRSLIDARIENLDKADKEKSAPKATRIKVE